ncbi:hypothetical protein [Pseudomonas lactis]|uniref:hypothetical protein n=1 Tax=Pseudomonas lactis TaxID=1615674 RepID=UPI00147446BF|nr:hypothetical protein [Pseudomonas lactis]NNA53266.1 hypothetical protein [Pseudomonas lactis]
MLAKNANDNARFLNKRGVCEFFASKLAPTEIEPAIRLFLQRLSVTVTKTEMMHLAIDPFSNRPAALSFATI